jgi:hypothetical protein
VTVSELLAASAAAHEASLPRKGAPRDKFKLLQAASLRVEALVADPEMSNAGWSAGKAKHQDLMAFYAEQLGESFLTSYAQQVGKPLDTSYAPKG